MTHIVVAGHWPLDGVAATTAVNQVAYGIQTEYPDTTVDAVPFGSEAAFLEAAIMVGDHGYAPIVVGRNSTTSAPIGQHTIDAWNMGLIPVIEGGHQRSIDCGLGFLSVISGIDCSSGTPDQIHAGLRCAMERWRGYPIIAAASTTRPLLGLNSVMALDPELHVRNQDRDFTVQIAQGFATAPRPHALLPLVERKANTADPSRIQGSGAGGGVAAMVAALGGRIVDTGTFLATLLDLPARLAPADVVCVLEPYLDSPLLAEACLDTITTCAAAEALPVVAVGARSSLSGYERAEWGIHGVLVTASDALVDAGRRIAHTWIVR